MQMYIALTVRDLRGCATFVALHETTEAPGLPLVLGSREVEAPSAGVSSTTRRSQGYARQADRAYALILLYASAYLCSTEPALLGCYRYCVSVSNVMSNSTGDGIPPTMHLLLKTGMNHQLPFLMSFGELGVTHECMHCR